MARVPPVRLLQTATVAEGAAIAVLTGWDGTPLWRAVRVVLVAAVTALAVFVLAGRRNGRWLRGLTALLAGIAGTSTGIGVGVAHLSKAGLSVAAVAGLVTLVTGVGLLGAGAVMLTQSAHRWWRLLALPAAILVLGFVLYPLTEAVYATNVPPTSLGTATPASDGLTYQNVTFRTADKVLLSGWYIPARNGAAVVLLHGAGSTRSAVLPQAAALAGRGYGVLLFDARGHGRSGGHAMDFGWYGDLDTTAAVSFLTGRPDVRAGRIAAVGMSMGGEEAIGAAASDPRIRAVVAEGATNRVYADKGWLAQEYGIQGTIQQGIEWMVYTAAGLLTSARTPAGLRAAAAMTAPRPILLIAAGQIHDEAVAGRWIQRASPATVSLWVAPGAGHTGGLATHPAEWTTRVTAFLGSALDLPPS